MTSLASVDGTYSLPQSGSASATSNSSAQGPSQFDDALQSAQQNLSTSSSQQTNDASNTPDQPATEKSAAAKDKHAAKPKQPAKAGAKAKAAGADDEPAPGEADTADLHPTLTLEDVPAPEGAAAAKSTPSSKAKKPLKAAVKTDPSHPVAIAPPVPAHQKVKPVGDTGEHEKGGKDPADPTVAAVGDETGDQTAVAAPQAAAAATTSAAASKVKAKAHAAAQAAAGEDSSNVAPDGSQTSDNAGGNVLRAGKDPAIATADEEAASASSADASAPADGSTAGAAAPPPDSTFAQALAAATQSKTPPAPSAPAHVVAPPAAPAPPEAQFAAANNAGIITSIHAKLLPNGGNMQLHLNPPDLGALSVSVHMRDGVMSATFETSNDQASRLLSHSLDQLKSGLEAQGVSVGSIHVQQAPKSSQTTSDDKDSDNREKKQPSQEQQHEQQRREMLRRMWRRLSGDKDPLDMVA